MVPLKVHYSMFSCRSWASHHSEDGDPRLHASSHPGDVGELWRSGERCYKQPAQWCTPRQLQPQSVPQLGPKQSTHTITVVTVHLLKFSWCSLSPPSAAWWGGAKEEGLNKNMRPTRPTSSSATTQNLTFWSAFSHSGAPSSCAGGKAKPGLWETTL